MIALKTKFQDSFFKEESRVFRVSERIKLLWAVELDLLAEFARICKKHSLTWFIDGGTLLGAVRHGGFIPWDDDIDICMRRNDYNRLCEVAPTEVSEPYFFQSFRTDVVATSACAHLRRSDTTGIIKGDMCDGKAMFNFNQGIFIDIFPLDAIPDNQIAAKNFLTSVQRSLKYMFAVRMLVGSNSSCKIPVRRRIRAELDVMRSNFSFANFLPTLRTLENANSSHDELVQSCSDDNTERLCTISHWPLRKERQYYLREWFDNAVTLDFEMLKVPAPAGYEQLLTGLYGNWHEYVIGAPLHGGLLIDIENPYTNYF